MPGAVLILKILRDCSKPFTRRRAEVWVSGCLSVARSLRDIKAGYGPSRMRGQEPRSSFLFPVVQSAPRMRPRSGLIWAGDLVHRTAHWTKISGPGGRLWLFL